MERYYFRNGPDWVGEFRSSTPGAWEEFRNEVVWAHFVETSRTAAQIGLFDATRSLEVSLPTASGTSCWRVTGTPQWTQLYQVDQIGRTFTPAQVALVDADVAQARTMLDRAITRILQVAVFPDAQLLAMRRAARNIFKINVIDPPPEDALTQGFAFTNLAANMKQLRDQGFDAGFPTRVFEPDSTSLNAAWVIGTTDPVVHIHPKYFYLDSQGNRSLTLIHERAHTVLRLNGHPPGNGFIPVNPADGDPAMTADDAIHNPYCYEWLVQALQ